jgi:hypothetical protein
LREAFPAKRDVPRPSSNDEFVGMPDETVSAKADHPERLAVAHGLNPSESSIGVLITFQPL